MFANVKKWIWGALAGIAILAGLAMLRKPEKPKDAIKAITEDKSRSIELEVEKVEATNEVIIQHQKAAEEKAKPAAPSKARTLEEALKEWNKDV